MAERDTTLDENVVAPSAVTGRDNYFYTPVRRTEEGEFSPQVDKTEHWKFMKTNPRGTGTR
jgi:hypothetical protein